MGSACAHPANSKDAEFLPDEENCCWCSVIDDRETVHQVEECTVCNGLFESQHLNLVIAEQCRQHRFYIRLEFEQYGPTLGSPPASCVPTVPRFRSTNQLTTSHPSSWCRWQEIAWCCKETVESSLVLRFCQRASLGIGSCWPGNSLCAWEKEGTMCTFSKCWTSRNAVSFHSKDCHCWLVASFKPRKMFQKATSFPSETTSGAGRPF